MPCVNPATAWLGGRMMSEFFAGAAFLSYTGTQHVAYMRTPSACINDPVTTYPPSWARAIAETYSWFVPP